MKAYIRKERESRQSGEKTANNELKETKIKHCTKIGTKWLQKK